MPQRKCAKTELKKVKKRKARNLIVKQNLKSTVKKFKKSIETKDINELRSDLNNIYKTLDKAASKKIIHPNKATKKKSLLATLVNKSQEKTETSKKKA
ncbi:MAG: 30S ribosomal protein S20 [Candidatus Omnitrophica bacterium]|nr:30S ribosomal protein S20 [Candidatus Omnitrophota bacterium]